MDSLVYALCALTCASCTVLLWRGYFASRMRFLLWSALCFTFLTATNIFVYIDLILVPEIDFQTIRNLSTLMGLSILIYGMIKETV